MLKKVSQMNRSAVRPAAVHAKETPVGMMAPGRCTMRYVRSAESLARSPLNPVAIVPYTAATVSKDKS